MCIHYSPEWAQQINSRNKQYSLLKLPTWWHRWSRERGEGRQRCKPRLESERGSGTLRGGLLMKLWRHHLDLRWMICWKVCFTLTSCSDCLCKLLKGWEPVPSGYPNPTRYPVFLSIPDPTRFSFRNQWHFTPKKKKFLTRLIFILEKGIFFDTRPDPIQFWKSSGSG